jgi:glycosyltransferase involved in cell wall biosynthesis
MALGIPHSKIFCVPHFVPVPEERRRGMPDAIVAVGRICTQKNPAFFAEVASQLSSQSAGNPAPLRFYWIGAGDATLTRLLEASGVTVTGWLDREDLLKFVEERAAMLVHGAYYEGLPLALVEALSLGVPVVARRIPSLADLDSITLVGTAREAAATVLDLLQTKTLDVLAEAGRQEVRQKFSLLAQRSALTELYALDRS